MLVSSNGREAVVAECGALDGGAENLGAPAVTTSLVEVTNQVNAPCRVFLKNEYEQPSGSFKLRGIGHMIGTTVGRVRRQWPQKHIACFALSGGNAGLAVAWASRHYGIGCTVVVPTVARPQIIEKLRELGAHTIVHGESIYEADLLVRQLIKEAPASCFPIHCHPYDNPLIWEGHESLVDEVFEQLGRDSTNLKAVVASVGGGGLHCGIAAGLGRHKPDTGVVLIETKQAPTFSSAIAANQVVMLESVKSMATSLACSYLTQQSLDYYNASANTHVEVIDDVDAVQGSVDFFRRFGVAVEPACGASVLVLFRQTRLLEQLHLAKDDIVVVVVCGGSYTDEGGIREFEQLEGVE